MKINILATGQSPDFYSISGEIITAYHGEQSEEYDLSAFPEGGVFQEADMVNGVPAIRNIERINGELMVTLCQQVGAGHWLESDWIDAEDYDADTIHVRKDTSKSYSGKAWAKSRKGQVEVY